MGKKYIIELEDKPFHNRNGDFLYRVKGFNSLVFDMTGVGKLTPYTEPDLEQVRKEAYEDGYKTAKVQCNIQAEKDLREVGERHYQKGLSDAWEAARKLALDSNHGGLTNYDIKEIFGVDEEQAIINYSASEAIEKIRQYEQEKEEIKVGDEVKSIECGWTAIVTKSEEGHLTLMGDSGAIANGYDAKYFAKTGRHFPEIAEVLKKMRSES